MDFDASTIWASAAEWLAEHFIAIAIIVGIAFLINFIAERFLTSFVRRAIKRGRFSSAEAERMREDTVIVILRGATRVVVWVMAGLMILSSLGIAIGPLIAAAGIAGVALGFGAQYFVKDVISGLFIILENQYRVGDVVTIDGTSGLVEDITLRMTTLRDLDGVVHHIQNGVASKTSNMTKELSRVNLNVGISYDTNLEKVIKVVNEVGESMASDPDWKDDIIEPPKFLRVDDFADSAVIIKILGDTQPSRQWDVTGELRKRLKIAFDKHGIEIPFPQRVMHTPKK